MGVHFADISGRRRNANTTTLLGDLLITNRIQYVFNMFYIAGINNVAGFNFALGKRFYVGQFFWVRFTNVTRIADEGHE